MATKTTKKSVAKGLQLTVLDWKSGKTTTMQAPEYLLHGASPILISQVVHTLRKRSRVRTAHTKERAEVRGGGRKPWQQKHTGRSRHGSSRSPLWVGGGITFGPRARHERVVPVRTDMKRRAMAGVLRDYMKAGQLLIGKFAAEAPAKTKDFAAQLPESSKRVLLVMDPKSVVAWARVANNVRGVKAVSAVQVTVADLVAAKQIIIDEQALPIIEKRCNR